MKIRSLFSVSKKYYFVVFFDRCRRGAHWAPVNFETKLLTKEASGDTIELSLLMIHGSDHLMTAVTVKDLAAEIIDVYRKMDGQDITEDSEE